MKYWLLTRPPFRRRGDRSTACRRRLGSARCWVIKEYPTPTTVGMYDALLSAPFPFVLTQSFAFLGKATGQGLLQRQHARMSNAGDFAVSQAQELIDALDALTSNEFVMGDHHMTLQVLADAAPKRPGDLDAQRLDRLNDHIAQARTLLADVGMTVAREDLALEAAFWAQLPGNFRDRPRKAPISSRNFAAMAGFHNYPAGRATGNHWGAALAMLELRVRARRSTTRCTRVIRKDPDGVAAKTRKGHTFICGPTGSGKTVFIGFMVSMLARQGATQVLFDKDKGLEILARALGGVYVPLHNGHPTGFNPLQLPESTGDPRVSRRCGPRSLVRGPAPLTKRGGGRSRPCPARDAGAGKRTTPTIKAHRIYLTPLDPKESTLAWRIGAKTPAATMRGYSTTRRIPSLQGSPGNR